ncbi:MAG TPA: hypothetical protein VNL74_07160 [Methylococcus sp.]|nr:hypothetical protein [Methylococcus sp.]
MNKVKTYSLLGSTALLSTLLEFSAHATDTIGIQINNQSNSFIGCTFQSVSGESIIGYLYEGYSDWSDYNDLWDLWKGEDLIEILPFLAGSEKGKMPPKLFSSLPYSNQSASISTSNGSPSAEQEIKTTDTPEIQSGIVISPSNGQYSIYSGTFQITAGATTDAYIAINCAATDSITSPTDPVPNLAGDQTMFSGAVKDPSVGKVTMVQVNELSGNTFVFSNPSSSNYSLVITIQNAGSPSFPRIPWDKAK